MSSASLSMDVRRQLMSRMATCRLQTPDCWEYAVANTWLKGWHTRPCQGDSIGDGLTSISKVTPVTMATSDADNTYVPETQWKMYLMWFGVDNSYEYRRRPITSSYLPLTSALPTVLFDRELDFLQVGYGFLEDFVMNKPLNEVSVFAWDNFEYIGFQLRRLLGVAKHRCVRLWFSIRIRTDDIVLEPIVGSPLHLIAHLLQAAPDFREILTDRQTQQRCRDNTSTQGKTIRQRLDDDWRRFGNSMTIALLVEETGVSRGGPHNGNHVGEGPDEDFESIMTISSIRNQWDDILTTSLENFTEDLGEKSQSVKEHLLDSARNLVGEKLQDLDEIRGDLTTRVLAVTKKEEDVQMREDVVEEKEKELRSKLSMYKSALESFQSQQKKIGSEMKRIESQNKISETMVTLNVGGHKTTTSVATLTKVEDSLLAQMFSGRHSLHRQEDGSYFLDRDGTNFRHVLNYLREGPSSVKSIPEKTSVLQELIVEGDFYKLPEFVAELRNRLVDIEERAAELRSLTYSGAYSPN